MGTLEDMLGKIKQDNYCSEIRKSIVTAFEEVIDTCENAMSSSTEIIENINYVFFQLINNKSISTIDLFMY